MTAGTSGVRPIVDPGKVAYIAYWMSIVRDIRVGLSEWQALSDVNKTAWRAAAEAVLDENYYETGGQDATSVAHHCV